MGMLHQRNSYFLLTAYMQTWISQFVFIFILFCRGCNGSVQNECCMAALRLEIIQLHAKQMFSTGLYNKLRTYMFKIENETTVTY